MKNEAGRQTSELDCTFLNDFEKAKDDECKDRWQQAECGCSVEFGTRDGIENLERKRVGTIGNIAAQHHRDAHFATRPCESQKQACCQIRRTSGIVPGEKPLRALRRAHARRIRSPEALHAF